jgi:hypothetical protein
MFSNIFLSIIVSFQILSGHGPDYVRLPVVDLEKAPWHVVAVNDPDRGYELSIDNTEINSTFMLDHEKTRIGNVDELYCVSGWLVVIGSFGSAAEFVQLVELSDSHDSYYYKAFNPVFSEKSGRIAFEKFYYRYTPREKLWPSIELVSVKENPAEKKTIFPVPPWKVYDEKGYVHAPVSPLAWSPDGNRLAFVDKHGIYGDLKGENTLYWVLIDFSENPAGKITVTPIDVSSYKFPGMGLERKAFSLPELYWQDEDSLCGDMGSDDRYWRSRKVEISPEGKYLGPCDDKLNEESTSSD